MSPDYEKLKKLYDQIDMLINPYSSEFKEWKTKTELYLSNIFGNESNEIKAFKQIHFTSGFGLDDETEIECCLEGLQIAKGLLQDYLEDAEIRNNSVSSVANNKNVFIVHGHDGELLYKISNLIRKAKIHPIILKDEIDNSMTIIEKLEEYSSTAKVAIVLFTPDDVGKCKTDSEEEERARQNVVFEAGYFMALLGRKNTLVIKSGNVKLPGDIDGMIYTDKNDEMKLIKELHAKLNSNGFNVSFDDLLK